MPNTVTTGAQIDRRFACPCCGADQTDPRIKAIVGFLEQYTRESLTVTSAYRCFEHNLKVGGTPNSSHLRGLAVDIACGSDALRFYLVHRALELNVSRIGISKNFIHLDIDRAKNARRIWVY